MDKLFLIVLSMSTTGAGAILFVLAARLLLRRAPKVFSYALWAVVLFRLLCPVTLKSPFSLAPDVSAEPLRTSRTIHISPGDDTPYVFPTPVPDAPDQDFPVLPEGVASPPTLFVPEKVDPPKLPIVAGWIWLGGAVLLMGYSAVSLLLLRRRLVGAVPLAGEKGVWLADHIPSPFVLGLFRPRIYLPSELPQEEREYVLLHERTHIRRLDHVTRALAWLALIVHWFDPLVWLAFHLAGKDMEMSCDEAVLARMGRDVRADYSTSLLRMSTGKRLPAGPLAFGGGDLQGRIKNVLSYKEPVFWVGALALILVLGMGVALATDPDDLIRPNDVVSFTEFDASSSTTTAYHTIVYTPEDRQKDMQSADSRTLSQESGAELIRLINLYKRTVYGRGELTMNGTEHHFIRMDRADGSFYLLDYWYWSGVNWNPLTAFEDPYTTLVTYYDADGSAGTTWQMEYAFDRPFKQWWSSAEYVEAEAPDRSMPCDDLTLSVEQSDSGPFVRIDGSVGGVVLTRGAFWYPETVWREDGSSELSMIYPAFTDSIEGHVSAWWADEERTSVTLSTHMAAALSSLFNVGWWEFTVDLGSGTVTRMDGSSFREGMPNAETRMYPQSITDEEAVQAARVAAKLMTAAEDVYRNDPPLSAGSTPSLSTGFTPSLRIDGKGYVFIDGLGDAYVDWGAPGPSGGRGSLYFAQDPAFCCPALAGELVEGGAHWRDESTFDVTFNVNDERVPGGTVSGFRISFSVDMDSGTVVDRDFRSMVEGESLELTDREMVDMACILAELIQAAGEFMALASIPAG